MMKLALCLNAEDSVHQQVVATIKAEISLISSAAVTHKISFQTSLAAAEDADHVKALIYKLKQISPLKNLSLAQHLISNLMLMELVRRQSLRAFLPVLMMAPRFALKVKVHQAKQAQGIYLLN